jgi:hypothetical protein
VTFPKKGTDGYEQALKQKEVLEHFYDQTSWRIQTSSPLKAGLNLAVLRKAAEQIDHQIRPWPIDLGQWERIFDGHRRKTLSRESHRRVPNHQLNLPFTSGGARTSAGDEPQVHLLRGSNSAANLS